MINTLGYVYVEEKLKAEHIRRLATHKPSIISYRLGELESTYINMVSVNYNNK